jgi:hypothetical protein
MLEKAEFRYQQHTPTIFKRKAIARALRPMDSLEGCATMRGLCGRKISREKGHECKPELLDYLRLERLRCFES